MLLKRCVQLYSLNSLIAMASHTLKEGERLYRFELLKGGQFAEQQQCGVLQISGHCTLFAAVFKVKASS